MTLPLAACVSGGGRTVLNFLDRIEGGDLDARVALVIADRDCAAVDRLRARDVQVRTIRWRKEDAPQDYAERVWPAIESSGARLVCLAGFLRLLWIPDSWYGRVMNIHPALLPAFGGKGLYGDRVHRAVLEQGVRVSGCTVHFTDNVYDHGPIILQRAVPVLQDDDVGTLAARVFAAECLIYPEAVRLFGEGRLEIQGRRVRIEPEAKGERE